MSDKPEVLEFGSLGRLVNRIRDDLKDRYDFVLLFAHNGIGKTRLSMAFKDIGKKRRSPDTLYFNAFTEDLFFWDNDLEGDSQRLLKINSESKFFSGLEELATEDKIKEFLFRYADFDFDKIDYKERGVAFFREADRKDGKEPQPIKVSRGEENTFIWCFFLAIVQLVLDGDEAYEWVKYIYIDDPVSSLDDNNVIAIACGLADLLEKRKERGVKVVISSHHGLFFNVLHNELKGVSKSYLLDRPKGSEQYFLQKTNDTPLVYHLVMLRELKKAIAQGELYTYHFNVLRSILERTAVFFGLGKFSECLYELEKEDKELYSRALNLLSHGGYSFYEPREMVKDNKDLFQRIFNAFLKHFPFNL